MSASSLTFILPTKHNILILFFKIAYRRSDCFKTMECRSLILPQEGSRDPSNSMKVTALIEINYQTGFIRFG